jgi:hypothetical protein
VVVFVVVVVAVLWMWMSVRVWICGCGWGCGGGGRVGQTHWHSVELRGAERENAVLLVSVPEPASVLASPCCRTPCHVAVTVCGDGQVWVGPLPLTPAFLGLALTGVLCSCCCPQLLGGWVAELMGCSWCRTKGRLTGSQWRTAVWVLSVVVWFELINQGCI